MNERIKQLMVEAGIDVEAVESLGEMPAGMKFAELIVRECAGIANKQFSASSGLDDRDSWTAAEIKKHFGVEE